MRDNEADGEDDAMMRAAVLLALALILAAFVHGGIYQTVVATSSHDHPSGEPVIAYRVNRFTGSVVVCAGRACAEVSMLGP